MKRNFNEWLGQFRNSIVDYKYCVDFNGQHNCKATGYWKTNSIKLNFLLLAHEYLFVLKK